MSSTTSDRVMFPEVPPDPGRELSAEEFFMLPDDGWRMELVRGHIVREPPAGAGHGGLGMTIAFHLTAFVREHGSGRVFGPDTGFTIFRSPDTVRAPDVAFVAGGRFEEGLPTGYVPFAPDLAVEVVSPSNTASELQEKVLDYLAAGTRLVWVVDPRRETVTVYRSRDEIRILGREDALDAPDILAGFHLELAELFES